MNKIICHDGVKGQKHGKRRYQYPDGTRTPLGKLRERELRRKRDGEEQKNNSTIQPSDDYKQSKEDKSKAPKGLSNAELKRLNERMKLEKSYRELTAAEKKKGESFAKGILKDIAKQSLTEAGKNLATDVLTTLVADPISKALKEYTKNKDKN